MTTTLTQAGALTAPSTGNPTPAQRKPLGKIHSTIRLGDGQWIEIRRGWIDHAEHIGLGAYDDGRFTNGILIPRRALEPLSEAFADIVGFLGLTPNTDSRPGTAVLMDVLAYIRVSTTEQADSGLGLAAQRAAIQAEAERRGWNLLGIYEDAGASGKSVSNRPGLDSALSALRSGRAEALVVAKLDRLSRSLLDFAALMETARKEGWALVALDLGVDTTTPSGEMVASVMATFAQFERRLIGQRTKDALAIKKAQGVRLGRPRAVPDEVAERIEALRQNGHTWRSVAEVLTDDGIETGHGASVWSAASARYVYVSRRASDLEEEAA